MMPGDSVWLCSTRKVRLGRNRAQNLGEGHPEIGLSPATGCQGPSGAPSSGGFKIQKRLGRGMVF